MTTVASNLDAFNSDGVCSPIAHPSRNIHSGMVLTIAQPSTLQAVLKKSFTNLQALCLMRD
jgi:hypothetical protein